MVSSPNLQMVSSEALLLDIFNLHDFDRIVTYLTANHGKKKGVASGARRKYSRFAGQLQPLSKVRLDWVEKDNRDLVRISSVEQIRPPRGLDDNLEDLLLGTYLADHIVEFAQENESSQALYRLLDSTLEALMEGVNRFLVARYFEAWVLRLSGLFPSPTECPVCGKPYSSEGAKFSDDAESIVCVECSGESRQTLALSAETLTFLRRIGNENLHTMNKNLPPRSALNQSKEITGRIRRSFLNHELRSYGVIQDTLGSL